MFSLTVAEKDFLLRLLSQVSVNAGNPEAIKLITMLSSLLNKVQSVITEEEKKSENKNGNDN